MVEQLSSGMNPLPTSASSSRTPTRIYLSASVANEALNLKLRDHLPADRFELTLPQEFTPDVSHGALERGIYERCIEEMERSSVGLLLLDAFGIDCAMESGWYAANHKPLVGIANSTSRFVNNWMVKGALTHCVTLEPALYEVMKADPILSGHVQIELLDGWEDLGRVLEQAGSTWSR